MTSAKKNDVSWKNTPKTIIRTAYDGNTITCWFLSQLNIGVTND